MEISVPLTVSSLSPAASPISEAGVLTPPSHVPLVEAMPFGFALVGTQATTSLTVVVTAGRPMTLNEIVKRIVAITKFMKGPPNITVNFFGTLNR